MNTSTITASDALTFLQKTIERADTKRFAIISDPLVGTITLAPIDDDDAKPYYEPSPEGEAALKESFAQAEHGQLYPIETLFKDDA